MDKKGKKKNINIFSKFQSNAVIILIVPILTLVLIMYTTNSWGTGQFHVFYLKFQWYIFFTCLIVLIMIFLKLPLILKSLVITGFLIIASSGIVNSSTFDDIIFEKKIELDIEDQHLGTILLKKDKEYSLLELMDDRINNENAPHTLIVSIQNKENDNEPDYYVTARCMFDDWTYLKSFIVNETGYYHINIKFKITEGWESKVQSVSIIIKENSISKYTLPIFGLGTFLIIIGVLINYILVYLNKKNKKEQSSLNNRLNR